MYFRTGRSEVLCLDMYITLFQCAHNLDLLQIKSNLDLLEVKYNQDDKIETLRNLLKKKVLEEILKEDHDNKTFFETCLLETNEWLDNSLSKETEYPCCLVGCLARSKNHLFYVRHLKKVHPSIGKVSCNFKRTCKQNFSSIDGLIAHIKEAHSRHGSQDVQVWAAVAPVINIPCKCDRESCGGIHLKNTAELIRHYNSYHSTENRECIFVDCRTLFHSSAPGTARNHIRLKHKIPGNMNLKSRYLIGPEAVASIPPTIGPDVMEVELDVTNQDIYDEEDFAEIEALDDLANEDDLETNMQYYLAYYSDFLSRLAFVKFVPQTTIQDIAKEFLTNTRRSLARQETLLRKSLVNKGFSPSEIDEMVKEIFIKDPFLHAQEQLNTEYKRKTFVQSSPTYTHPQEILLNRAEVQKGAKKEVYHYISIIDSLKTLTMDSSFLKMREGVKTHEDDKLRDLQDGSVFKKNSYFSNNKDAFAVILYSDGVEMRNPLGAARGCYKIVFVYYTLCEIQKSQRSQIDRLQVTMAFKEKLLKKYSLKTILKPLIDDLNLLERGVEVSFPTRLLKCGVACYVSDNLEASMVGGFSANFSSNDVCRVCHCLHRDLEHHIHEKHELWTAEEYDAICDSRFEEIGVEADPIAVEVEPDNLFTEVESDGSDTEDGSDTDDGSVIEDGNDAEDEVVPSRGLRYRCPLNRLDSFHAVTGFPLDVMHDVFEGKFSN